MKVGEGARGVSLTFEEGRLTGLGHCFCVCLFVLFCLCVSVCVCVCVCG